MLPKAGALLLSAGSIIALTLSCAPAPASPGADATPTPAPGATETPVSTPQRLAAYFPAWVNARNYHVDDIPAGLLTHLLYAFGVISDHGECISANARADAVNFPLLRKLKQQYPPLQTLISIGGYSDSGRFSDVALSAQAREHFAQSCVAFMQQNGFDGIDIDWEFPVTGGLPTNTRRPQDKQNFTLLLAELRRQLDAVGAADGAHRLLTVAAPAGPDEYANIEPAQIDPSVDWINLMAYDFYTAASRTTNFASALYLVAADPANIQPKRRLYNADAAVKSYMAAGVPPSKIVLGVPFYGRAWQGVPDTNHGLYQANGGAAKGTWGDDGALDFRDVEQNYVGVYGRYWQDEARAPWLYSPAARIMITYEDEQSLTVKADYVMDNRLGGIMIWQIAGDDAQHRLVNALHARLFR